VETLYWGRQAGAYTISITGKPTSRLAQVGHASIIQTVHTLGETWNPYSIGALGLGNYIASLITLYLIAFRLGHLRGTLTQAQVTDLKGYILQAAAIITRTVASNTAPVQAYARDVQHLDTFQILGAGPSYAVALFSAAKLFEQPHANGVAQELEEWAHEQYFLTRPGRTHIFVIAPPGVSRRRAIEQIQGARDMGATIITVCDAEDEDLRTAGDYSFPIVGRLPEEFTPLTYIIPNQLFATYLHQARGRPPLTPPYDINRLREVNFRQIFRSHIPGVEA
jgi:glucosamine--fructose-6-phosphate aminotransferase (isomerizing)